MNLVELKQELEIIDGKMHRNWSRSFILWSDSLLHGLDENIKDECEALDFQFEMLDYSRDILMAVIAEEEVANVLGVG